MGNGKDMIGMKINMWTVLEYVGKNKSGGYMWRCKCECGNERIVDGRSLRCGASKCCGCTRGKNNIGNFKHGGRKERLYSVWQSMKSRCLNRNDTFYYRYGGRGIRVCDDWLDYEKFRTWALSSGYDPNSEYRKCTLDRIENDGSYCPENCRWVAQKIQNNNRSSNHIVTNGDGVSKTLSEWSRIVGIKKDTLRRRICDRGWDVDRALTEPVHKR